MKPTNKPSQPKLNAQLQVEAAQKRMQALRQQGRFQEALDICLEVARAHPGIGDVWTDAAANCVWLRRWPDAIRYGQTALARGSTALGLYDALAHAHGALGQADEARRYGLQALDMRERQFGGAPVVPPPDPGALPSPPSARTRQRNIIAFSLFGGDSKYCEPAVLNVQEQPRIYPHWVCRFYVDDSVPEHVMARLRAGGAQIVRVEGAAAQWPGPMWRFLALDDPQAQRILFRDADSVISRREAAAVAQWLSSGKRFHMMRDYGSNTELILAGQWGMVAGSLPPLNALMARFMSAPLASRHFADQYFLRQYVWPYARASLMQHDSVFGFRDAAPFPEVKNPDGFGVGHAEGGASFTQKTDLPDGSAVRWALYRSPKPDGSPPTEELICAYPGTVKEGAVSAHIPTRYARQIEQGAVHIRLTKSSAAPN